MILTILYFIAVSTDCKKKLPSLLSISPKCSNIFRSNKMASSKVFGNRGCLRTTQPCGVFEDNRIKSVRKDIHIADEQMT